MFAFTVVTAADVEDNIGDEFDKPFEVKLSLGLNDKYCTVSLRESSVSNGNKPSATASNIHGSSPLINAFERPFIGGLR